MADKFETNFNLYLTVDVKPDDSENWQGGVGFITKEMLKEQMPAPSEETMMMYCGPPPFENMMKQHLKDLGYSDDMVFKF